jgi:hypothetical protein
VTEAMSLGDHHVRDVQAGEGEVGSVGLQREVGGVVGAGEEVRAAGAQPSRREGEDAVQLLEVAASHRVEGLAHGDAVQRELRMLVLVDGPRSVARDAPDEIGGPLDGVADDADVEHDASLPSFPWPVVPGGC